MLRVIVILIAFLITTSLYAQIYLADNGLTTSGTGTSKTVSIGGTLNNAATSIDFGSANANSNFLIKKGTSNYFFVGNNGKIGVGLNNPAYTLDVNGIPNFDNGGGTGTILRFRANNGYVTMYGDASSDLHIAARLHVDQALYPDGGLSFNSWGAGIGLNSGPITGISTMTFNGSSSFLKMFHDYNSYQLQADQGIIMQYNSRTSGIYPRAAFQVYKNGDPTENPFMISAQGFGWLKNSKVDEVGWIVKAAPSQTADIQQIQDGSGNALFKVAATGLVSIGLPPNPLPSDNLKLAINGTTYSKKIKITQTNWPDYVFHQQYQLQPLSELEKFISINKHLPEVPSAKDVEVNGLDLGDNQAVLLKKIEELTLYVIELDKKIEQQQQEIDALKKKDK